jgi:hypothetical protein
MLVVHLDSGRNDRDYQNRLDAIAQLPALEINGVPLTELGNPGAGGDNDIIILGDWNTMGRDNPPVTPAQEIADFDQALAPGFSRLTPTPACSEYYQGEGGLLDHVVRSLAMEESAVTARITGYCAVRNCQSFNGATEEAYESLSDHCPIVFEVRDEDRD